MAINKPVLFAWLLFLNVLCIHARAQELDSMPIPHQEQFLLHSTVMQENRTIWVYTPPSYTSSTDSFPVLYLLDGGKHFPYVRELVEYLSDFEQPYISPMIVVGIPNVDRGRDLTPGKGADKFLGFIQQELVPYIDHHYRTHPYRILEGHSLGGFFSVYANTVAPALFNASILISPALDGSDAVKKLLADFGKTLDKPGGIKRRFFVTLGNEGTQAVDQLKAQLEKSPDTKWAFKQYKEDNHFSVPYKSMYDGLRFLYTGWFMDVFLNRQKINWPQIAQHFSALSGVYGYHVIPTEDFINGCGYEQLNGNHFDEAIGIFQANIRLHPHSWNAYDSMGEAYMRAGNKKEAISYYQQSLQLNPQNTGGKQMLEQLLKGN